MNNGKNTNAARALAMGVAAALVLVGMAGTGAAVSGLVGEWHFDGNAQDSSGNGNDGIINGATFTTGISGQALSFDGMNDYVTATDNGFSSSTSPKTVSAWIKTGGRFDSYGNVYGVIFNYGTASNANMFWVGVHNDGNIVVTQYGESYISSGVLVTDNKWHNIVVTYDGSTYRTYIDDVQSGSKGMSTNTKLTGNSFIGDSGVESNRKFNGLIDEVRIYNRALTASEIQAEYNALTSTPTPTTPAPTTSVPTTPTTTPTITQTLTPTPTIIPTTGSISVSSSPSGAGISLDGSYRGTAPKTLTDVSQGSHTVELTLAGYEDWSQTMSVNAGGTYYVSAQLKPLTTPTYTATTTPTYTATPTPTPIKPSVSLHGEKTDVVLGEDILLKLSAVNLITKPKMHVQVIIIPPSGMSVTSSEFSKSGAGQFTSNYELEPGDGKDIEVRIKSNQVGQFNVDGRVVYYFGNDKDTGGDSTLSLPIRVREVASQNPTNPAQNSTPGFGSAIGIIGILFTVLLKKRRG